MNTPPLRQRLKSAAKLILAMGVSGFLLIAFVSGYSPIVKLVFVASQFALIIGLMIVASQTD